MRIYMVVSLLDQIGGIEAALVSLCAALKNKGHEVIVYVIRPIKCPNQNAEALRQAGVETLGAGDRLVHLVDYSILSRFVRRLAAFLSRIYKIFLPSANFNLQFLYYLHLHRAFRKRAPDLVHVHGWGCGVDPPAVFDWLRNYNYPTVYTEHASPDPDINPPHEHAPMNQADVLIAVSKAGERGLVTVGRATRPIVVIPYSVEPLSSPPSAQFSSLNERKFTITCIARLAHQKGHMDLLNAMSVVVQAMPASQLLLAGDGALRTELLARVEELNLQNHVRFLGIVTRKELPDLLAQTDVVTLPSYWEGLSVALIESLSAGKPLVVSNVGGNPELVSDGTNGLIVPPQDPEALARAFIRLAGNKDLRRLMGIESKRKFNEGRFSSNEVADLTLSVYQTVLKERTLGLT